MTDKQIGDSKPFVITRQSLDEAWQYVREKDSSGGIDHESVQGFGQDAPERLDHIFEEILSKSYLPYPYLRIDIPKDNNEKRMIGLPAVSDKIVQQALRMQLEPVLERMFLDTSYAYRPDKGALKAINRTKHIIHTIKKVWLAKCDIDRYFDTIPHERLKTCLAPIVGNGYFLELIMMFCRMGYVSLHANWQDRQAGIPQGAILSPLLANLYLHPLDQRMRDKHIDYVRYSDDFIMLCTNREEAQRNLQSTIDYIKNKLGLALNPDYRVCHVSEGFKFLGVWITDKGVSINVDKIEKLKRRIDDTCAHETAPGKDSHEAVNGIANYYAQLVPEHQLFAVDEHIKRLWIGKLTDGQRVFRSKKSVLETLSGLVFITKAYNGSIKANKQEIASEVVANKKAGSPTVGTAEVAIRKRKREYEKKAAEYSGLYVYGFGRSLGLSKQNITVKEKGRVIQSVPASNLKNITVATPGCSLSSKLITFCSDRGIAIDFTDNKGTSVAKLYHAHTTDAKLWGRQLESATGGMAQEICRIIVNAKMQNQINLLKYYSKHHSAADPDFFDGIDRSIAHIESCMAKIIGIQAEPMPEFREQLMAFEGQASSAYWEMVKIMVEEETGFDGRERKGAADLMNSLLNYGYAILYNRVWTSLLAAGINPNISYIHTPRRDEPTLVFDMIEPFRQPIVDRAVISMVNLKTKLEIKGNLLAEPTKKILVQKISDRLGRFDYYRGQRRRLQDIIRYQAFHFADFLNGEAKQFRPYIMKW